MEAAFNNYNCSFYDLFDIKKNVFSLCHWSLTHLYIKEKCPVLTFSF